MELEFDVNDILYCFIDKRRKLIATVLLRAFGYSKDYDILKLFCDTEKLDITRKLQLEKLKGEGVMIIKGYQEGEFICIEIIDNGQGIKDDGKHRGFGIGLSNVDKRIKLHYGDTYGVTLKRIKDMTHGIIVLPKESI